MFAHILIGAALALLPAFALAAAASAEASAQEIFFPYVIVGENGKAYARAVTSNDRCPEITLDGAAPSAMIMRSVAARVSNRGSAQEVSKGADFPVFVCETVLPAGVKKAAVAGASLPVPVAEPQRILFIGDTGCRMKASEDAFQACNDTAAWPFEAISKQASAWRPDLVVHLGDVHYRESPCPTGNAGCTGSPWGYGFDAWQADFFRPARALLESAPWVVVRGNHESCSRAGQGWFRFLDTGAYDSRRSCDDPALDDQGDFTSPYAVPIAADTQLIVFDSSKAAGKPYSRNDDAYGRYVAQLRQVDELSRGKGQSFFLNHHPVLAFGSEKNKGVQPGNTALLSVMRELHPERLFASGINLTLNGHVHTFEAITFKSGHPSVLVSGNAGSALARPFPAKLSAADQPVPGAVVDEFSSQGGFGFLTLERADESWKFTEWDHLGKELVSCELRGKKMHCVAATTDSGK